MSGVLWWLLVVSGATIGFVLALMLTVVRPFPDSAGIAALATGAAVTYGAFGGALSGAGVALMRRLTGSPRRRGEALELSILGSVAGGVISYALLFNRQTSDSPVLLVVGPVLVIAPVIAWQLARHLEKDSRALPAARPRANPLGIVAIAGSAIVAVFAVFSTSFVAIPSGSNDPLLWRELSFLAPDDQTEILVRSVWVVVFGVAGAVIAIADSARRPRAWFMSRYLLWAVAIFGIVAVNAGWLSASVTSPVVLLRQEELPQQPLVAIVTLLGWLFTTFALVVFSGALRRSAARRDALVDGPVQA